MEDITDYRGSGETATDAIQAAIDACGADGGGVVRVPPGEYVTGTVRLRSGVRIHLEGGATVRGSPDSEDYVAGDASHRALFAAVGAEDVAVSGSGTIHGNGLTFVDEDAVIDPDPGQNQAVPRDRSPDGPLFPDPDRPDRLLLFNRCSNVDLRNVTIRDAPHWTVHLLCCEEVDINGVDILNDLRIPNSDGINLDMSRNVHISDCTVEAGDDAICLKTGGGYSETQPCEHVTVTGCTLQSRSSGIKLGSETKDDIRQCRFADCVVYGSNRGLGIQHRDAGTIERIYFDDIAVETRHHTGNWWGVGEPISVTSFPRTADTDLGDLRNIRFSNVDARGEGSVVVYANPDHPIRGLRLDGLDHRVTTGTHSADRNKLDLRPSEVSGGVYERDLPAMYLHGVERAELRNVTVEWDETLPYHTHALECEGFDDLLVDGFRGRQADSGAAIALSDGERAVVRRCIADHETDLFLACDGVDGTTITNNSTDAAETAVRVD
jgi:hypothetical protein